MARSKVRRKTGPRKGAPAAPVHPPTSPREEPPEVLEPVHFTTPWREQWPYLAVVLLLPVLVLWHKDSALYTPPWYADPWFYLGYFRDLLGFKRDLFYGLYYGSRLSWILPGFVVHSLFSPLAANFVLRLLVEWTATLSLFTVLRITSGVRTALLATMVFSVHPWLWAATGWDYVDGAGIAYCLLAMALLTHAATEPVRARALIGAGAAIAALGYTHLFWFSLAPVLPLFYVALVWWWHRTPLGDSLRALAVWAGAGFAAVTLALCLINYWLDGHFWFYAPSVAQALTLAKNFQYTRSVWWNGMLAPWLWSAVAAAATAVVLLPARLGKAERRRNTAALLFGAQMLLAGGWMAYLQSRGSTVLGHYPYSSDLLPFVFLVLGSSFWPAVENMRLRTYLLVCAGGALVFAALWWNPAERWAPPSEAVRRYELIAACCLLPAALLLRRRTAGTLVGLAGFAAFTAVSLSYTVYHGGVNLHGNREQFRRIMQARDRIETVRHGRPFLFWFDQKEADYHEYYGLNSIYLAEFSRLSDQFPGGCDKPVDPGSVIVVTSQRPQAAEVARAALAACWQPFGMRPAIETADAVRRPETPYTLAILRAEADRARWHPLRAVFDAAGQGRLEPVDSGAAVPLPLGRWTAVQPRSDKPSVRAVPGGLAVRTPVEELKLAAEYVPLTAPSDGEYHFTMQLRDRSGLFSFGAGALGTDTVTAVDARGHRAGDRREMSFWMELKRGQTIVLRIKNNDIIGHGAASFVLEQVTVEEVPAETL